MNDIVKMSIDGVEVEGLISFRTDYCFNVQITKPFQNISGGCDISYFARGHRTYKGEYGKQRILEELKELYILGKFLFKNKKKLQEKTGQLNINISQLSAGMIDDKQYKIHRIALRKRLRSGEIYNKKYQKLLIPIRKESEQLEQNIWQLTDTFFEENFPMIVPIGMRDEVLAIING